MCGYAYLKLNDIEKATAEARRMLIIAEVIQSDEQIRIAKEILDDCTMLSEMNKNIIFLLNNQV